MVLRAGIEPSILALKGLRPKPLDDRSILAEDTGFEPVERFIVLCFSKALHSTTLSIFH